MAQFHVTGMTCGGCARSVSNAVKSIDPLAKVDIDLAAKTASVDSSVGTEAIARAITAAGYAVAEKAA